MPGQNFAEIEWSLRRLENFLIHHPYISQRSKITPMIRMLRLKNEKKKKEIFCVLPFTHYNFRIWCVQKG